MTLETKMNLCKLGREGEDEAHAVPEMHQVGWGQSHVHVPRLRKRVCGGKDQHEQALFALRDTTGVFYSSKPRMCILADSDEESSSAGSSDEEEVPQLEPQGSVGDKNTMVAADG